MNRHNSEWLSALADGELRGLRRWWTARHVRHCAECAAEYRRLLAVRELLAANPAKPVMGESADFFWSKVKREIQTREGQRIEVPVPRLNWSDWLGQHQAAFATAAVILVAALWMVGTYRRTLPVASVGEVATAIPNTTATPVSSSDSDVPVIWVSGLPWTEDMTEMQTLYANLDT